MARLFKVLLLLDTFRSVGHRIVSGIARYSSRYGPWSFSTEFNGRAGWQKRFISSLERWKPDGLISLVNLDQKYLDKMSAHNIPGVVSPPSDRPVKHFAYFVTNSIEIGKIGADYLIGCGFKHFAFCGYKDTYWSLDRGQSFRKTIAKAGFETHLFPNPQRQSQHSLKNKNTILPSRSIGLREKEHHQMVQWLKGLPKPVGLMTCNDDRGLEVIEICKIAGIDVPEEIAVIGVDDDRLICSLSNPQLSSIALNTQKAGYDAAHLLNKMMTGQKVVNQIITFQPTYVITRQSSDLLAMDDRDVAEALRFIRRHSKEIIQVNDVVNAVALSRRVLENRFRNILNRSIHDEIRRVRTDQIIKMLVNTNLSIAQISLALGYGSDEKMARHFTRFMNISPRAYREKYGFNRP